MVIGEGAAGKTSLINAFTGTKINMQDQVKSTCGIEQHLCELNSTHIDVQQQQWQKKDVSAAEAASELQVCFQTCNICFH